MEIKEEPVLLEQEAAQEQGSVVSITEAAKLHSVTRQAIYVAIKQKKLKAHKTTRWEISIEDLKEYAKNKYSRQKSLFEGEPLFDNLKGYYSINQVAEMLNVPTQKVYYATRTGTIKGTRKGSAWVISEEDIKNYKDNYLSLKKTRKNPVQEDTEVNETLVTHTEEN